MGIFLCILFSFCLFQYIEYRKSDIYLLKKKGYSKEEITLFQKRLKKIDIVVKEQYDKNILSFIKEKYFIENNLKEYLRYKRENPTKKLKDIVSIINTGAHKEIYEDIKKADLSKKELILVNKFYYLEEQYPSVEMLVTIPSKYAYAGVQIQKDVLPYFKKMWDKAKEDGITLIASAGYRSYARQKRTYNYYSDLKGDSYADEMIAHPGFSENQTGLAITLRAKGTASHDFDSSDAYQWLLKYAADYGFILRYPKGKENITLFPFEPCHYRYVGVDAAKKIKKENITFEEYYAYYVK